MDAINSRVSPSLHPANISNIEGYGDDTASAVESTMTAFKVAYDAIGAAHHARDQSKANPTWNEAQRILETASYADKQTDRIGKSFDQAMASLSTGIADLERDLTAPVTSQAAQPIAAEIRAHVKALPPSERVEFIRQAIERRDQTTATAILGTVPYLSGIDADVQALYTRRFHETISPDKAKRLKVMEGARDLIFSRSPLIVKELANAVGASPDKVQALRSAKNRAEEAFILRDGS